MCRYFTLLFPTLGGHRVARPCALFGEVSSTQSLIPSIAPSIALASKLVHYVLRKKKRASHKTGFILVRSVILGTYGPHGSVMRYLLGSRNGIISPGGNIIIQAGLTTLFGTQGRPSLPGSKGLGTIM